MESQHSNSSDSGGNAIRISICFLLVMIAIDLVLLASWVVFVRVTSCKYTNDIIANNIFNVLGVLISLTALAFGVSVTNNGALNKGGTKYYPFHYPIRKVNRIITPFVKEHASKSEEIVETILGLQKADSTKGNQSAYFDIVFFLQELNENSFNMAWNNFNYYGTAYKNSDRVQTHYNNVKFYIYCRVYERYLETR